ncbi:hypothetical protein DERF_007719 [Dermatophagoides farinae]|uniref:Uncharacterized protein n=1 Tax=Dermatophagoides farinae TaxID=6954 RepID=A0A922L699_DERFA|nr:hypothetical protein DERF_007719 [Dermatophagoides farinae]
MLICYITIYLWIINLGSNPVHVADANLLLVATSLFEKLRAKTSKLSHQWLSDHQKRTNYNHRQSKSLTTIPMPIFSDQAIFGPPIIPPIGIPVFEPIHDENRQLQQQQQQQQQIQNDLQMSESSTESTPILSTYQTTLNGLPTTSSSNHLFQLTIPLYIPEDFPTTLLFNSNTDTSNIGTTDSSSSSSSISSSTIYEPFVPLETFDNNPIITAESSFHSPNIQYIPSSSSSTPFEQIGTRLILLDQLLREAIQARQRQQQNNKYKTLATNTKQTSNHHFILNSPKEIFETSENRNQKQLHRPFWLDLVEPRLRNNIPSYQPSYPLYWNDLNIKSKIPSDQLIKNNPKLKDKEKTATTTTTTTTTMATTKANWPYNSRYEPEQIVNNDEDDDEEIDLDEDNDDNDDGDHLKLSETKIKNNTKSNASTAIIGRQIEPGFFNFSDWRPPMLDKTMNNMDDETKQQQQQREARTMDFIPLTDVQQPSSSHLNPIRIINKNDDEKQEKNEKDFIENMLPMEHRKVENKIQYDNGNDSSATDMKQEGKNEYYADKGHFKHGWKNVYHKEEWGEANKYHDIWRYKDWKNRYYNQKEHDENESGKTTSMETTNNNENDDNDDDD